MHEHAANAESKHHIACWMPIASSFVVVPAADACHAACTGDECGGPVSCSFSVKSKLAGVVKGGHKHRFTSLSARSKHEYGHTLAHCGPIHSLRR